MKTFSRELRLARVALFLIYGWFGMVKVIGFSPASPLVSALLHATAPWMNESLFMLGFALFEVLIGTAFLLIGARPWVVHLFFLHMVMTIAPLIVLPEESWSGFLIPTLTGQYIIKNVALIALVRILTASEQLHAKRDPQL